MKKTLALVLALAMVFSTITVAFAAEPVALGADAQICADLGMLKGSTGTVDAAYVATAPTRIQAAVMFLRLKGLEAEATAFTGDVNFADADKAAWAKPIMAYLKANPQLGWAGDGKNFNPTNMVTAKEYYKVLLETLGYKQNTAEVVGDFTWDNVITFAGEKGLTKVAAVTSYTVNDLAIATVEALKLNVKDTTKTLVASLVEAGKVDAAKATTAGIYSAAASDVKLDTVKAVANNKVEVTFTADVDKAFAENVATYKVVVKGSTTALEVKSAAVINSTSVAVETAAQTAGTAYTMTIGEVSKNFAGIAKATGAPELDKVTCIDTNTLEVKFKNAMDRTSVEDIANYSLDKGATVKKAELWVDQDSKRKTVKLTTEGVANNTIYKLKIANVKSADLVAIKSIEKSFSGVTDTKAPTINGNVIVKNNQRILVNFTDNHGVDKATVEDLANTTIEGLKVTSVKVVDFDEDDYGYWDQVEINTEPMDANKKYTVSFANLIDGSVSKNAVSKTLTKSYTALSVDKTAPKAGAITVYGDTLIEVAFTETNRLDAATLTDINNYSFNEGLSVLKAEIVRANKPDDTLGKTVVLTTSTMDKDTTYKISVSNIADEFGNVMTAVKDRTIQRSLGQDIKAPTVTKVAWSDLEKVKVTFDERVDIATASDPANYVINKSIGTVLKASVSADAGYMRVDLTTAKMAENTKYTITIDGVKDRVGNTMTAYNAYFTSGMEGADIEMPEIDNISALNNRELRVTFTEKVTATAAAAVVDVDGDNDGYSVADASDFQAAIIGTIDGEKTVVLQTSKVMGTGEYKITRFANVVDKHNNHYAVNANDLPSFYGNSTAYDPVDVLTKDQLNVRRLQFVFEQPILMVGGATTINAANGQTFTADIDIDGALTTEALSTLTLTKQNAGVLPVNTEYKFDFSGAVTDYMGNAIVDEGIDYATFTTYKALLEDDVDPLIDKVEAMSTTRIKVTYTEELDANYVGSYQIKNSAGTVVSGLNTTAERDADDYTVVNVTLSGANLVKGDVYKLVPKTAARDYAGNALVLTDVSVEFVASAYVDTDYVEGVYFVDADSIRVNVSKAVNSAIGVGTADNVNSITIYELTSAGTVANNVDLAPVKGGGYATSNTTPGPNGSIVKQLRLNLKAPLKDDVSYKITITYTNNPATVIEYTFKGIAADGGIAVNEFIVDDSTVAVTGYTRNTLNQATQGQVTFSGWNLTEYVVEVVYLNVNGAVASTWELDTLGKDATTGIFNVEQNNNTANLDVLDNDVETAPNNQLNNGTDITNGIGQGMSYVINVYKALTPATVNATTNLITAEAVKGATTTPLYTITLTRPGTAKASNK